MKDGRANQRAAIFFYRQRLHFNLDLFLKLKENEKFSHRYRQNFLRRFFG